MSEFQLVTRFEPAGDQPGLSGCRALPTASTARLLPSLRATARPRLLLRPATRPLVTEQKNPPFQAGFSLLCSHYGLPMQCAKPSLLSMTTIESVDF